MESQYEDETINSFNDEVNSIEAEEGAQIEPPTKVSKSHESLPNKPLNQETKFPKPKNELMELKMAQLVEEHTLKMNLLQEEHFLKKQAIQLEMRASEAKFQFFDYLLQKQRASDDSMHANQYTNL